MSLTHSSTHSNSLSYNIDLLKRELYRKIDLRQNLVNSDVYKLSLKLDELINEYQNNNCQKMWP